ncbi:hypothetical protein [Mycobacteroides abscessus]|uniref:Uncharacterized protein n=1 Tax=Mycobacteroides abscessus TaxID=36809 RepID=A0A0U0ZT18_9MYCO|nr:hypothetical protein [Mycobacteroides abscessus]CPV66805.1 Uncharacterised protein [Mycobacteroides abscessus]
MSATQRPLTGGEPVAIEGGWCIKALNDQYCIDVRKMLFNYRIVLTHRIGGEHGGPKHAWCYYGHGVDANGQQRTMQTARLAAILAARAWDGQGAPEGYDRQAC